MEYFYQIWVEAEYPYPIYVESKSPLTNEDVAALAKNQVIADFEADLLNPDSVLSVDENTYRTALPPYEYMDETYGECETEL